jgi:hypothetical protein
MIWKRSRSANPPERPNHFHGSDSAGLPGWHSVVSGVLAYGPDATSNNALQAALAGHDVLRAIAPQLLPTLDRNTPNGIKVFCRCKPTSGISEVRVNGQRHEEASQALAALSWPEVTAPTSARFYAVAVHPD